VFSLEVSPHPAVGRTGMNSRPIRKRRPAPGESTVLSDPHLFKILIVRGRLRIVV